MPEIRHNVALAPHTTLGLGGAASQFLRADRDEEIVDALRTAAGAGVATWILGGGSNVVIADEGIDALVIEIATRGIESTVRGRVADLYVAAGEPWDEVVAYAVERDYAGLECLSGIPGRCGATPIQNVGAYGQEVAQTIRRVVAWDRDSDRIEELDPGACEFGYRDSALKREPSRWVVLGVEFSLRVGGAPTLRYGELSRALADRDAPTLAEVRDQVLRLRRSKSMVIDADDPNRRSVGSFFTNPVVSPTTADEVARIARARGFGADPDAMPRYPADGGVKLAAGWLIEAAGMHRGYGDGPIGLSSKHALALVHRGGGRTADLVAFARHVRDRVRDTFGVTLVPEPVFVGLPPL